MPPTIAEVLLDQNLEAPLDYELPVGLRSEALLGRRVEVPLGKKQVKGTITGFKNSSPYTLRPILRLLNPFLSKPLWNLAEWMAHYYCTSLSRVLRCFFPPNIRKEVKEKPNYRVVLTATHQQALDLIPKLPPTQAAILEQILKASKPLPLAEFSRAPINALVKKKAIQLEALADCTFDETEFFPTQPKQLNTEQEESLRQICEPIQKGCFSPHLLHGVTGSGKTEVYLQAIQYTLSLGKSALMLVPEIALTTQTIERFQARFGIKLAILHHRKSKGERTAAWEGLQSGEIKIAIGARSAVFSPLHNLGLIIIDEEHDSSYKQSEEPTYHARDVAVKRAQLEQAVVVLGSATPCLESVSNAKAGKYKLSLLSQRATKAVLPTIQIVDLKRAMDRNGGFTHFSSELLEAIKERCHRGEQTLLLLNRRGFHRTHFCSSCTHVMKCPHCDLSLIYHRSSHHLSCPLCDEKTEIPRTCPTCHSSQSLEFRGFGTEHVERSLHAIFPEVRTLRMDRDTTRKKESHEEIFKQFKSHKADVLIGTQMIAKGLHFPSVTLVGVLQADASLHFPDVRAAEMTFQLLVQIAGRAGRAEFPGEVIFQTFLPNHPLLRLAAAQDFEAFYAKEMEERKLFFFPPFCRMVRLLFSGPDPEATLEAANRFYQTLVQKVSDQTQLLPPVPAGHPKVKDRYRFQFIMKTKQLLLLTKEIAAVRKEWRMVDSIQLLVDVDPTHTF